MENKTIVLDTIIQRNDSKFIANKLGEEMVMMNMDNGDFISMNNVGADIWNLCGQPTTVKDLIQQLVALYDISEEQCAKEVIGFLQNSRDQGIFIFKNTNTA